MRRSALYLRVMGFCALIAFAGCSRPGPLSTDPKRATREVNDAVPLGASETRARKVFTDRGFQFSALGNDAAANRLIVGTYTTPETMWQVGFIIVEDKVAARTVTVTDLRPNAR